MLLIYGVYHSFSLPLVLEKISPYISDEDHRRRRCCNGPNSDFSFQLPSGTQSYQSQNSDHKYRCSKNCTHRIQQGFAGVNGRRVNGRRNQSFPPVYTPSSQRVVEDNRGDCRKCKPSRVAEEVDTERGRKHKVCGVG